MPDRSKMLLHICCAPCSPHIVDLLRAEYEVTAFFFNPNIFPEEQYTLRLDEMRRLAVELNLPLVEGPYVPEEWSDAVRGLEDALEGGARCEVCFRFRLERAAREAAARSIPWFTTTLTVSPMKNAAVIHRVGSAAGAAAGVRFLEADFKKKDGFKTSCELSRRHGLYRQDYCGCEFSLRRDFRPPKKGG